MRSNSLNQSSPIATYYDEVYKGNFAFLGIGMYDLERVEVLRGPQGTLYGKNTTGGAVNLISRKPKLGMTEGDLAVGYGNYNRIEANGGISVPLGENLAARFAFTYAHADGWFKNQLPGKADLNEVREYGIKGTVVFEPAPGTEFVLRGSTSFQNPRNYGIYATPADVLRPGLSTRQIEANVDDRRRARTYAISLTANIPLSDSLTLTSVSSYDKGDFYYYEDTDGVASALLEIPYTDRASQVAQDLRITSKSDGPFNFLAGAYYNREKVYNSTTFEIAKDVDLNGDGVINAGDCAFGLSNADPTDNGVACLFKNEFNQDKESVALYTDFSYELSPVVTLRGGLRYTHDTGKQIGLHSDAFGVDHALVLNLIPPTDLSYKTDNVSGKAGVDFKLGDQLVYLSYNRGFRGNGFNAQAFFDPSEVNVAKPEKIEAFEIGAKGRALDRHLTYSTAAFYYRYSDQQFLNVDPATAAQTLINIPKSRIFGAEADLTFQFSDRFSFKAGIGLLDTRIEKGTVSGIDVSGNKLISAPSVNLTLSFDAVLAQGGFGKITLSPDMHYSSSQEYSIFNSAVTRQGGYALFGGSFAWTSENDRYRVALWAKNLGDRFYYTQRTDLLSGFGYVYNHLGNPRTYGITASARF